MRGKAKSIKRIMMINKINVQSLKEVFVQAIMEKILSGEMKPGARFPSERELAELTGVSRSIVNQGMLELEMKGFISMVPRKGNFVRDYIEEPTPHTIAAVMSYGSKSFEPRLFTDLMSSRMLIEVECVRLSCKNMGEELLSEMEEQLDLLARDPESVVDSLFRFHYCIIKGSGNSVFTMIYKGFEPVLRTMFDQHYQVECNVDNAIVAHRKLWESIKAHDERASVENVKDILNRGIAILKRKYAVD